MQEAIGLWWNFIQTNFSLLFKSSENHWFGGLNDCRLHRGLIAATVVGTVIWVIF